MFGMRRIIKQTSAAVFDPTQSYWPLRKPGRLPRRGFLKYTGIAALGTPLAFTNSFAFQSHSCVIIGAGLSGLPLLLLLKQAGWKVTVLEARDRIGGRVHSYSFPQSPNLICELGAEWVGENHERVQALCRDFKIELEDHRFAASLMRDGVVKRPGQWGFSPRPLAPLKNSDSNTRLTTHRDKLKLDRYDWWTWLENIGFTRR